MSVIPFKIDGEDRTLVSTREEYESIGGLNGDVIFIQNMDESQLVNAAGSNASYDLRVGDEYRDHRDSGKTELPDNGTVCLQTGSAVIIETEEWLHFPKSRFGHIVPKVSLLQKGAAIISSKIDPGYEGKLLITVFNLGKRKIILKKGQKFCTFYMVDIKGGALPYQKEPKRIVGEYKKGIVNKFRDFIENNQTFLTALLIVLTSLLILIQLVELIQTN